jgi:hypothetical protein
MALKTFDTYVDGLDDILRAFRKLPKEASAELRTASQAVAEKHMAPAWRNAAINYAGPWGPKIAESVKVKKDRVPAVNIGGQRKKFSNGASPTMVRYLTDKGDRGRAGSQKRAPEAFKQGSDWMSNVGQYQGGALEEWAKAVDRIIIKWGYL